MLKLIKFFFFQALHVHNPVFRSFTAQKKISDFVKGIGLNNAVIPQSMYIFKQPKIGGYVKIHQDNTCTECSL